MNSNNECKAIFDLDLDPIKVKLMHVESGEGWSREEADAVEAEYRRFLVLMKTYPDEQVAPLADVDTFWHYHILDTMKYAEDCENIFGYFLHHFPYVGLGGESDRAAHEAVAVRMGELYEHTFQEPYGRELRVAKADRRNMASTAGYSIRVSQTAPSLGSANSAYSIRVPQVAVSGIAANSAYSIRVPETAVSSIAANSAYSIRVPETAVSSIAANSAYSIRVPETAVSSIAANSAYSIRTPQNAGAGAAAHSAYSIRVPQADMSATAGSLLQRPVLAAA